jgi:plasmid stability protein
VDTQADRDVTLGTCLTTDEADLVRARAAAADRTVSAEIRRALRGYLGYDENGAPAGGAALQTSAIGGPNDGRG